MSPFNYRCPQCQSLLTLDRRGFDIWLVGSLLVGPLIVLVPRWVADLRVSSGAPFWYYLALVVPAICLGIQYLAWKFSKFKLKAGAG